MLDEKALRRADFLDGTPVTMADGQEWTLPFVDVYFCRNGDGTSKERFTLGDEYQALIDNFRRDEPMFTMATRFDREFEIAAWLLKRNYTLTDDDLPTLLKFTYAREGDPRPYAVLREDVFSAMMGYAPAPKHLAVV